MPLPTLPRDKAAPDELASSHLNGHHHRAERLRFASAAVSFRHKTVAIGRVLGSR